MKPQGITSDCLAPQEMKLKPLMKKYFIDFKTNQKFTSDL